MSRRNVARTAALVAMQAASTPPATPRSSELSNTKNVIVIGPPTIATPSVPMPVKTQAVGSSAKWGNAAPTASA